MSIALSKSRQTGSGRVSVGVDPKQTVPRPVGLGGIAPGDLVELLFPSGQDGAVTAEVNAVILEDGTAVGDEAQIASMFSHRLAYSSEWARWALVMQEDPSQTGSPAARDAERAELIQSLREDPNDRGDAATVAGRMAARKALSSILAQVTEANRAALLEYVQERAASLRLHAQREGSIAAVPAAIARNATMRPETNEVRMDPFTCRSPGQLLGIAGYADVLGGTAQGDSAAKVGTLSVVATGVCDVASPAAQNSTGLAIAPLQRYATGDEPQRLVNAPACMPEFFTTASLSPSSATITGVTYSYVPALGCTILGSQAATAVVSQMDANSGLTGTDREGVLCAPSPPPADPATNSRVKYQILTPERWQNFANSRCAVVFGNAQGLAGMVSGYSLAAAQIKQGTTNFYNVNDTFVGQLTVSQVTGTLVPSTLPIVNYLGNLNAATLQIGAGAANTAVLLKAAVLDTNAHPQFTLMHEVLLHAYAGQSDAGIFNTPYFQQQGLWRPDNNEASVNITRWMSTDCTCTPGKPNTSCTANTATW